MKVYIAGPMTGLPEDNFPAFNAAAAAWRAADGVSDGAVDWWLDGVKVGSYTGRRFTTGKTLWNLFTLRSVWGGLGDEVIETMTLDVDHINLSGK
jgi:hypothetical protein